MVGDHAWDVASLLDLPAVHKTMAGRSDDSLSELGRLAGGMGTDAWKVHARVIGELQRRGRYAAAVVGRIAKDLAISKRTAFELGQIDRKILLPRLRERGDAATFPIRGKRFYMLACRLAETAHRSPLEILQIAEQGRQQDRRFSARQLLALLGAPAETTAATDGIVAKFATLDMARFARGAADRAAALELAEACIENACLLVKELRTLIEEAA